jgi:tetratricopeptide (TPR) repeat protein
MNTQELIDKCRTLTGDTDPDQLKELTSELEKITPDSEPQWRDLIGIYSALGRRVWIEIMTKRFLTVEPANLAALLEEAQCASQAPSRQDEAIELVGALTGREFERAEDCLTLSNIYSNCGLFDEWERWTRKALDIEGENAAIRIKFIHHLISARAHEKAKAELDKLAMLAKGNNAARSAVIALALRMGEKTVADDVFDATMKTLAPEDYIIRCNLIMYSIQLGRWECLRSLVESVDFTKMRQVPLLDAVFEAIEGRGFHEAERQITATAIAHDPAHQKFRARARAQAATSQSIFVNASSTAPAPERAAWNTRPILERLRDLMFWR